MLRRARYCYGNVVCPSLRDVDSTSTSLRYRDHIGRKYSKIISLLVSLGCSLSADPTSRIYSKGSIENFGRNGVGNGKLLAFGVQKALISLKCGKIALRLLLRTNRKSYKRFWLVPKSATLDDLEGSLCTLFQKTCTMVLLFIYFSFAFSLLLVDN